ncbi:hypothetical protein, partial [Pseudomonas sp.]|uniref:hypothetical protein n=1 Tax=Pseudomonas sp. TaxID=306 RepID=UPI003BB50437
MKIDWRMSLMALPGSTTRRRPDTTTNHEQSRPKALKNVPAGKTKPQLLSQLGFRNLILTMTYSHMGKPHTTIGDASFHC